MMEFLIILILLALAWIAFRKFFQNRVPQGDAAAAGWVPYEASCGDPDGTEITNVPSGRARMSIEVEEHCAGVVVEQHRSGEHWDGVVPRRHSEATEPHNPMFTGTGFYIGQMPARLRVRCGGEGGKCKVRVKFEDDTYDDPASTPVSNTTVEGRCGEAAYVAVFNGLNLAYEVKVEVLESCNDGVEVYRWGMRSPAATDQSLLTIPVGETTATFRVQPRMGERDCWFRITCKGSGGKCRFKVEIKKITP